MSSNTNRPWRIYVSLDFRNTAHGPWDPDEITALVGVAPTRVHRRGDLIGTSRDMRVKADLWTLDLEPTRDVTPADQIEHLLDLVTGRAREVSLLAGRYSAEIACNVYLEAEATPPLWFEAPLLRRIAEMGLTLWFDFFFDFDDESDAIQEAT